MSKTAFIILATGEEPESMGRVVNALMGAYEYAEANEEIRIIFDGAGTQAAAAFADPDHKYHELYQKVRSKVTGACSYCADAYEVTEEIKKADIALIDEFKGHPSFKKLIDEGFTLLTF